jgi:hypothetical protein
LFIAVQKTVECQIRTEELPKVGNGKCFEQGKSAFGHLSPRQSVKLVMPWIRSTVTAGGKMKNLKPDDHQTK